jgi:hypothetical protein
VTNFSQSVFGLQDSCSPFLDYKISHSPFLDCKNSHSPFSDMLESHSPFSVMLEKTEISEIPKTP